VKRSFINAVVLYSRDERLSHEQVFSSTSATLGQRTFPTDVQATPFCRGASDSVSVMLISQAHPGFDKTDGTRTLLRDPNTLIQDPSIKHPDGCDEFLSALRQEVQEYKRAVAYVHGDSHYFHRETSQKDELGVI